MENMELNLENEELETTTETPAPNATNFESLYNNEKKRNKKIFVGGTVVGTISTIFYMKKIKPGMEMITIKKKAEKLQKKVDNGDAKAADKLMKLRNKYPQYFIIVEEK